jgi:hydrogenase nickel incorporation protein HypA/HybF
MHELSIAMGLIETATEEAARQGGVRVATLYVRIGRLSGVVSDALRFSFELAADGTPIEGAHLDIEEVPVTILCAACGTEHTLAGLDCLRCPVCDGPADVVRGRELELSAMEVMDVATDR